MAQGPMWQNRKKPNTLKTETTAYEPPPPPQPAPQSAGQPGPSQRGPGATTPFNPPRIKENTR